MPKLNVELITDKIKILREDVDELEDTIKKEYATINITNGIDKRVKKFEDYWDWGIKIVLGALIVGVLALIGLK